MKITFAKPGLPKSGALAVGILADGKMTPAASALDAATGGMVARALSGAGRFTGKAQSFLMLPAPNALDVSHLILIGLGDPKKLDAKTLRGIGGGLAAQVNQTQVATASVHLDGLDKAPVPAPQALAELTLGARLRSYRFDKYRTTLKDDAKPKLTKLSVLTDEAAAARRAFEPLDRMADGVVFARDLVSEPANVLHPESFAERCRELEALGVDVEILDEKKMRKLGMETLLAVGMGSVWESRLVVMQWKGGSKDKGAAPVAFVGKGVTFDTGGISLKPGQGMWDMKFDMAGAAAVCGVMKALAGRKAAVNAVGVIGLVENMPAGDAQRPGDVVTSMSGQTIEVLNTDAEGRLVLADALWYTQDRFKPQFMINLATLTGAILVALGGHRAGLFSNDDPLSDRLMAAGEATGDRIWRLPLGEEYDREIDGDIADIKNIAGSRNAGSIVAGQFLQRFVNKVPWAHLDIAGTAWTYKDTPTAPKGATGYGVALLDRLVADHYEG